MTWHFDFGPQVDQVEHPGPVDSVAASEALSTTKKRHRKGTSPRDNLSSYQALKIADRHLRTKCFSYSVLRRIDLDASSIFIFFLVHVFIFNKI